MRQGSLFYALRTTRLVWKTKNQGEFGGFTMYLGGQKFYPIQGAEKLQSSMHLTLPGPAGHGSMPVRGGAMAHLGQVLRDIERKRIPIHRDTP